MSNKQTILNYADAKGETFKQIAREIHAKPEVSNYEFFAQDILTKALEKEGFEIKKDVAGHRTGFTAVYKSKKPGPTIVFLAEYDALNGIGHACGHNLFGPTSALAAISLKQVIDETGGEVRVYGTPGEEGGENGCSKANFTDKGFFKDVDVALCVHPGSNEHQRTSHSLACAPVEIEFFGKSTHAAGTPWLGLNALDALIQVFNSINALRQQLTPDVRIHGIITKGGDAPNIIPEYTQAKFYLRAAAITTLKDVYQKVKNIVDGAALATGTRGVFKSYLPLVANTVVTKSLDDLYKSKIIELGETFADHERKTSGSTDVGNVSQVIPVLHAYSKISDVPVGGHSLEKKAACISEQGLNTVVLCAKALALTGLALIEDPGLLEKVKADHKQELEKQHQLNS